jgi:hypothetical protein
LASAGSADFGEDGRIILRSVRKSSRELTKERDLWEGGGGGESGAGRGKEKEAEERSGKRLGLREERREEAARRRRKRARRRRRGRREEERGKALAAAFLRNAIAGSSRSSELLLRLLLLLPSSSFFLLLLLLLLLLHCLSSLPLKKKISFQESSALDAFTHVVRTDTTDVPTGLFHMLLTGF